jgi:hypothetical protein
MRKDTPRVRAYADAIGAAAYGKVGFGRTVALRHRPSIPY